MTNMEYNGVICGDSDIILQEMLDSGLSVDLVLTDPPYNLNKDFGNNSDKLSLDDFLTVSKRRIELCRDLLKQNGSIIWFGIHHYIGFIQAIMYESGLNYRRMNIWYYENGFSRLTTAPLTQYEPFLWFSKSAKKWTYNVDDVRVPHKSHLYFWGNKPESLITEIIKAYCPKNKDGFYEGVILDPFHGSGTLGVCCEKLNKQGHNIHWIGIELEKRWCDIAEERLHKIE